VYGCSASFLLNSVFVGLGEVTIFRLHSFLRKENSVLTSPCCYTVSGLIQWALSTIETWCNEVGLSANPDKTGLVASTRKRKLQGLFEPRLFGVPLRLSRSVKYLGVILDSRLTWKEHMKLKQRRLRICCGPVGGHSVRGGVWDLKWFIGSMSPSSGRPLPLLQLYGGLDVKQPALRRS
jgi:hypothetical protein